ncbi:hypothetical protein AXF42_Ash007975 [Apostasia shenzhenica]|uniref:Uncharacterized protein n=1 Tax=Apostasia shenzhenica TaxID=1088818 RepID=A0A2I0B5V6_9ASPA|nr:hypothetical protein AXF42_Ash007975 [Apostasia shenzhenica]
MAERKWKTASGFSKKRAGVSPVDVPLRKKSLTEVPGGVLEPSRAEVPTAKVAAALAQTLESLKGPESAAAAEMVVEMSDSPVKPPPKAKGVLAPAPEKKEKPFLLSFPPLDLEGKGEKDKKSREEEGSKLGEVAQGEKEGPFLAVPVGTPGIEGPGVMMEEAAKEKGETLPAVPSVVFGEEIWGTLGDRLSEIRRVEEKVLGNTVEALEVVKALKGREDVEAHCLREVRELEGALSQATKRSLADQREQLGKAHSAHVKDLQKRIKDLDDDKKALREEKRRLREELTKAREALSEAKEVVSEARRREELSKSEVRSMRALVENSSGWRGRRMEDLEEAVKRAVKIVSASPVGRHTQHQAAFDALLQTLVDVGTLNQENIRDPAVLSFCGPKGPDRFFDAGSYPPEEIPPLRSYAGWGSWPPKPGTSGESSATPLEASFTMVFRRKGDGCAPSAAYLSLEGPAAVRGCVTSYPRARGYEGLSWIVVDDGWLNPRARGLTWVNGPAKLEVESANQSSTVLSGTTCSARMQRRNHVLTREELTKAREALSGVKEMASEARRREELSKSEVRSLRALVENSSRWRGRRMEDLEEAVKRAVKIVSASPVGRHTQH